jgi:hypothetical protein
LCAVRATEKQDKFHVDLTRHCGKSLVATSAVLYGVYFTWKYPRLRIEMIFQVTLPDVPPQNEALCAIRVIEECYESHIDLTRHCGKSFGATSAVLHGVSFTWKYPRLRIEMIFQVT